MISCSANNDVKTSIKDVVYSQEKNVYTCNFKGVSRSFILCLPDNADDNTSLLIMLHGLGGSAASFKNETQMEKVANARNYAVVYVDGIVDPKNKSHGKGWHFHDDEFSQNDVAFIMELVQFCQKEYGLGSRAFAAGFSNGGFMVNKLATSGFKGNKGKSVFTGVASVGGMMPKDVWEAKKKNAVAYLQINGTRDDVVPMEFMGTAKSNQNPSMEKVIEYYCGVNKVSKEYTTVELSNLATMHDFKSKVGWIIIQDGRHSWPAKEYSGIDVDSVILDFFDALP